MDILPEYWDLTGNLLLSVLAGAVIGAERSYHRRPAGFRTHALVCLTSSALMSLIVHESAWMPGVTSGMVQIDPTRMAQGIMTGIGFLGAGVIMREGLTIRGLTTAASVWITAAVGILIGIGFHFAAIACTVLCLAVLAGFLWIEMRLPTLFQAHLMLRFDRQALMPEPEVRALVGAEGFAIANVNDRLIENGSAFEYRMVIRATGRTDAGRLSETLNAVASLREFRISSSGD